MEEHPFPQVSKNVISVKITVFLPFLSPQEYDTKVCVMGQGIPEERLKNESITAVQYREDFHDVNIHMIDDNFNMDEMFFL